MNNEQLASETFSMDWLLQGNRPTLLILSLVVVAIISILITNNMPGTEMCRLFDDYQPTYAEQNRILTALGSTELTDYRIENGRIQVPVEQKGKFLAAIKDKGAMPDALVKETQFQPNPFHSRSVIEQQQLAQKKKQVCQMIKRLPFVVDARFEFDRQESGELFQPQRQTAVVMVTPQQNAMLNRQQLQSVQRTVAAAIVGIAPNEVAVIDTNAGIAYDDIGTIEQSNLIELVNWKMERREHYQRLLYSTLSPEFPGIAISVRVQASVRHAKNEPRHKKSEPFKLASQPVTTTQMRTPSVGVNTTNTVTVDQVNSTDQHTQHDDVRTASFEAILPHAIKTFESDRTGFQPREEKLNVKIIVPDQLFASPLNESDATLTPAERFRDLSDQLVRRVRAKLPAHLLSDALPIEIVAQDESQLHSMGKSNGLDWMAIKSYWPLLALLVTGVFAAILVRNQNRSNQKPQTTKLIDSTPEKDLESQLSELIESDPATAARVLKNWIQQD